jgi:hypothetical protein
MSKKLLRISVFFLVLVCLTMAATGCIGDKISIPVQVESAPNTFRHDVRGWGERIVKVEVWERDGNVPVWQINATRDVYAADFVVTVGQVPDGFEQVIPPHHQKFSLVRGKEYFINIHTNLTSVHALGAIWTAE